MNDKRRPVGLILSAGFSSRMKDFKPLMKIGGRTPLQMLIESFSIAGIKDIFVVVGHNADKIRGYINEHFADKNINIVLNEKYADGMFTSVKAGIRAAAENGSGCVLMTPVDIPLIPPYVIKAAIKAHEEHPGYFTVPCFEGKKGHPLCIPEEYFSEILESSGENGLKSVTSLHEDKFIRIDTHAEGITLDMDTPEAYSKLLEFYEKNKYPDEEKCWKILYRMQTPSHVLRHCLAVADTGIAIAEELNKHGMDMDVPLVEAAGMLHDVLRVEKKHWEAGAKLLLDYGYPEVADIVDAHMNYIPEVPVTYIDEKNIICLSDKLRQEETLVTLEERLEPVKKKWKDDPEALNIIETKINAADAVVKYIDKCIDGDIYDVLRERDAAKKEVEAGKPKPRRLVLIRHGETEKHKSRIFLGQKDVPLDDEGRDQCMHVGIEMQHFGIETDIIYTSTLSRAVESAQIIADAMGGGLSVVREPEFSEMKLGHWDGLFIDDIKERFPEEYEARGRDLVNYRIDDEAENFVDLQKRAMKKLDEIIASSEGDIMLVSHSGVLRVIKCALQNRPLEDIKRMKFDRGTYDIMEIPPGYEASLKTE